jgi:hypothetical protein
VNTYGHLEQAPYTTYAGMETFTYAVLESGVERRVGASAVQLDINALASRLVGAEGLTVDVLPPLFGERQTGQLGLQVDFTAPQGVQFGAFATSVDFVPSSSKQLGAFGVMVDFIPSLIPTTAVRWSGSVFEMGTASPVVRWNGTAFVLAGSDPIVVWEADKFGVAP